MHHEELGPFSFGKKFVLAEVLGIFLLVCMCWCGYDSIIDFRTLFARNGKKRCGGVIVCGFLAVLCGRCGVVVRCGVRCAANNYKYINTGYKVYRKTVGESLLHVMANQAQQRRSKSRQ